MRIKKTTEIDMDDCMGFYINLDLVEYQDKSYKYRITRKYYKYDKPEFEKDYYDTLEEAQKELDLQVAENGGGTPPLS
jgi:hypothetical protein